jgi:hypothetical protein
VRGTKALGDPGLEAVDPWALGDHRLAQRSHDGLDVLVGDVLPAVGEERLLCHAP